MPGRVVCRVRVAVWRVEQEQCRLTADLRGMADDVELAVVIAVYRIDQFAGAAGLGPLALDLESHRQRGQPQREGGRDDQPCEFHPVRQRLIRVEEILPEIVIVHWSRPNCGMR